MIDLFIGVTIVFLQTTESAEEEREEEGFWLSRQE
jgi:hypothetical protein